MTVFMSKIYVLQYFRFLQYNMLCYVNRIVNAIVIVNVIVELKWIGHPTNFV